MKTPPAVRRGYRLQKRADDMAATRTRILQAARTELIDDALQFSLETVAARSGVTRPTIYRHFGSRSALLGAVIATISDEAHLPAALQQALDEPDARSAMTMFLNSSVDIWSRETDLIRAALRLMDDAEIAVILQSAHRSRHRDALAIAAKVRSSKARTELARGIALLSSPEAFLFLVDRLELQPVAARRQLQRMAQALLEGQ